VSEPYKATFFVIPAYILDLPGITLGYLKVYETIFQFWNKGQPCFLGNDALEERTGLTRSYVYNALNFFESINELKRVCKKGKRYFVRPESAIETNCSDNIPESTVVDNRVHCSGPPESTVVDHNIKKINKELKKDICTSVPDMPITASQTNLKTKPKPHATKEVLEYVEIWNEIAGDEGCPKVGNNKRQLGTIKKHLEAIKQKWEAELSPKSFKTWLVAGIEAQHYMLTTYHHSMDVCLKWKHFNEIYKKIEGKE
jgi:hypothetical protein